jgi:hypothetical protein
MMKVRFAVTVGVVGCSVAIASYAADENADAVALLRQAQQGAPNAAELLNRADRLLTEAAGAGDASAMQNLYKLHARTGLMPDAQKEMYWDSRLTELISKYNEICLRPDIRQAILSVQNSSYQSTHRQQEAMGEAFRGDKRPPEMSLEAKSIERTQAVFATGYTHFVCRVRFSIVAHNYIIPGLTQPGPFEGNFNFDQLSPGRFDISNAGANPSHEIVTSRP